MPSIRRDCAKSLAGCGMWDVWMCGCDKDTAGLPITSGL